MTNKKILTLVSLLLVSFLLVGCFPKLNQPPGITSDPVKTATVGVEYVYDVDATDPDSEDVLTYTLIDEPSGMVIDVDSGVITWIPTAAGDFPVIVLVSDGDLSATQDFTITVVCPVEPGFVLVGIEVDPKKMTLFIEDTEDIKKVTAIYEIRGYEVTLDSKDCLFLTSNSKIATVKKDNSVVTVKAVKAGTANIIVSYKGKIDTVMVTVIAKVLDYIVVLPETMDLGYVPGVHRYIAKLSIQSVTAYYNDETNLGIDLGNEDCTYESDWSSTATVDGDGVVTAGKIAGTATITVSYEEEKIPKTDTVAVTVWPETVWP